MSDSTEPSERLESTPSVRPPVSRHAAAFWQECDRYHGLAERFERNIEITHPGTMTGRHAGCPSDNYCCGYCVTTVRYYECRGERL